MVTDKTPTLKLALVTKGYQPEEVARVLRRAEKEGFPIWRLAENRVLEAEEKFLVLEKMGFSFEKHFIGKLQSRKIRDIVRVFDVIQSVENMEQAQKISSVCAAQGKMMRVFVQVNLSGLSERSGVRPEEALTLIESIRSLPYLHVQGVMGMATPELEEARQQFSVLKRLQGNLEECSMGMSGDYQLAVEAGSTMLRLGRVIFEEGLPKDLVFE